MKPRGKASSKKTSKKKEEDADDEAPAKDKKPGTLPRLRALVVKHLSWDRKRIHAQLEKEGYTISTNTSGVAFYDTRNTLKIAMKEGLLTKEAAKQLAVADEEEPAKKAPVKKVSKK
jgi:hypothetical protein